MNTCEMIAQAMLDGSTYEVEDSNQLIIYQKDKGFRRAVPEFKFVNLDSSTNLNLNEFMKHNGWYSIDDARNHRIVFEYARLCGCQWLAKDRDRSIWAFNYKPCKLSDGQWDVIRDENDETIISIEIYYDLPFLRWEDDEPYNTEG